MRYPCAATRLGSGAGIDTVALDDTDAPSELPPSSYSYSKALATSSPRYPSHKQDLSTNLTTICMAAYRHKDEDRRRGIRVPSC